MLPWLRDAGFRQPVIYYIGRPDPDAGLPAGAFGITNRPDQLLHLVIDALSRVRRGSISARSSSLPSDWRVILSQILRVIVSGFHRPTGGAALDAAIELAEKNPDWPVEVPTADRKAALDRANANRSILEGSEILWVDDRPLNNRNEERMLRSFGALITFAATTDEASRALQTSAEHHQPFDIILSDISRDLPTPDPTAGLTMLPRLRNAGFHQPVIYYIGRPDPDAGVPAGAFGITNRPDQLLQLVVDALSRVRVR